MSIKPKITLLYTYTIVLADVWRNKLYCTSLKSFFTLYKRVFNLFITFFAKKDRGNSDDGRHN